MFILIFTACMEPLGLENFQIPKESFTSSSKGSGMGPYRARLGFYRTEMWCASQRDLKQFLKVFAKISPLSLSSKHLRAP